MSNPNEYPSRSAGDDEDEFPYDTELPIFGDLPCEPLEEYKPGGPHPIIFGDRLGADGRFRVVSKLGAGGYGTVWLCQDTASPTLKWRAVKVMAASVSKPDCKELRAMETFRDIDRPVLENDFHITTPLEHFWFDGPNGRHLAMVFPFRGFNTVDVFRHYGHLRNLIKDLCFQVAKSLELIHSRGLCHGDFRPCNILFRLRDGVDSLPEKELLDNMREPQQAEVLSIKDGKPVTRATDPFVPEFLIAPTGIFYNRGLCATEITVTDFGVSYPASNPPKWGCTGIQTPFAAPEERFRIRELLGYPTDIWALGCTIAWLACGITPFGDEDRNGAWLDEQSIEMEKHIGPMPEPFRSAFRKEKGQETPAEELGKPEADLEPVTEIARREWKYCRGPQVWDPHFQGIDLLRCNMTTKTGTDMTARQVKELRKKLQKDPSTLPSFNKRVPSPMDCIKVQLEVEEMDELSDLLMSIFKWHPKDRATLQQVLDHPWFEGRNKRAAKVPAPGTSGKKSAMGEAVEAVKSRATSILSGAFL